MEDFILVRIISNFIIWFSCFGLSFLLNALFDVNQGKAFIFFHLEIDFIFLIIFILMAIFGAIKRDSYFYDSLEAVLSIALPLIVIFFSTWMASKLFNIDFYLAYQLMTFGRCLSNNRKKER